MRIVRAHIAYRVVETCRIRPYQAQYYWHTANQRASDWDSADQGGLRLPKPLAWIIATVLAAALTVCFVMLVLLAALLVWVAWNTFYVFAQSC